MIDVFKSCVTTDVPRIFQIGFMAVADPGFVIRGEGAWSSREHSCKLEGTKGPRRKCLGEGAHSPTALGGLGEKIKHQNNFGRKTRLEAGMNDEAKFKKV